MKKTIFDHRLLRACILACIIGLLTLPQTADAQERRVELTSPSMTVKDAIGQIEQQTGLKFGLSEPFDVSRTINFGSTDVSLDKALALISAPDHSYSFYQNYILIQKKEAKPVAAASKPAPVSKPALASADVAYQETPKAAAPAPAAPSHVTEVEMTTAEGNQLTYLYYDDVKVGVVGEPNANYGYISPTKPHKEYTPKAAIKTNFLIWGTTTPNVALEFALGRKWTLETTLAYNPWDFGDDKSFRLWMVQPELRYWFCNAFENHFVGIHGIYGEYNISNIDLPGGNDVFIGRRYKGNAYGGGISYGYHTPIGKRWGLEFTLGVGYLKLDYDKYDCSSCDEYLGNHKKDYFGVTKAGISMVFMLK